MSRILIACLIVISVITYLAYSYYSSQTRANTKIREFCHAFDIPYAQYEPSISTAWSPSYYGGTWKKTRETSCGDVEVELKKANERGQKFTKMGFAVGHRSKEIELYYNRGTIFDLENKYGFKKDPVSNKEVVNWPPFIAEEEAKKITKEIAGKLAMPSDMVFENIRLDEKEGIWNAVWVRKKDGYRYENDEMLVSIMATTGDFIGYYKTYMGTPCPTEIKIDKEEFIKLGWTKLTNKLPGALKSRAKELYNVKSDFKIIQTEIFSRLPLPMKRRQSKLALIVRYWFTGGDSGENYHSSEAVGKRYHKRIEMGYPPWSYEIRVDAANGEILSVSPVMPSWLAAFAH